MHVVHFSLAKRAFCVKMEAPSDSDEEDEFIYNPLKLPLGYDGKPIPYWLYKLHGLNQVRICMAMQQPSYPLNHTLTALAFTSAIFPKSSKEA